MRIVYCLRSTANLGGVERIVISKANFLVAAGYDIVIITTDQMNRASYFKMDERIRCYDLGIDYERNRNRPFLSKAFYFIYNRWLHQRRLKKLLSTLKADIVISTFFNEMPLLPKIDDGSKKVLEFHSCRYWLSSIKRKGLHGFIEKVCNRNMDKSIRRYDAFVVLTREDALAWSRSCNNLKVIPNMLPINSSCRSDLNSTRVIAVGRYVDVKGFDRLIAAWAIVAPQKRDWTLHIYGEGDMRSQLENQIQQSGLQSSVFLEGGSKTIHEEYAKSSIFVLTSKYEGFSLVIVEAASVGLPAVSFDCPCGPKDLITDGENGFLVGNGDIEGLADKLLLLMNDEALRKRMGNTAYEYYKRYLPDVVMQQWMSLFDNLVTRS